MARRRTFLHPKPKAWFFAPEDLRPTLKLATWHALENAIGRPLTDNERAEIARAIGDARFWRDRANDAESAESVRATLAALAMRPPAERKAEHLNCDATTHALMVEALYTLGGSDPYPSDPETIAAAALAACKSLTVSRGRRATWKRGLAARAVELWRAFGGAPYAVSASGSLSGDGSPPVRFGVAMFAEVGPIAPVSFCALLVPPRNSKGAIKQ